MSENNSKFVANKLVCLYSDAQPGLAVFKQRKTMKDTEIVSLLNHGDKKAYNSLFCEYYKPLVAYAYRMVELDDAEDIVQELFMWIWEKRERFSIVSSLNNYMFRAVYLRCLLCIQNNRNKRRKDNLYWQPQDFHAETPLEYFETKELLAKIEQALQRLPSDYREAFMMQRFHGMSYKQIAQELGVSAKTVDYRIQKARKMLSKDLDDYLVAAFLLNLCNTL